MAMSKVDGDITEGELLIRVTGDQLRGIRHALHAKLDRLQEQRKIYTQLFNAKSEVIAFVDKESRLTVETLEALYKLESS